MNAERPIITQHESGWLQSAPKVSATEVYVVSYHDGRLTSFSGRPGIADRPGSRYVYVIDTAERHTAWSFATPSRQTAYRFSVTADVSWRVSEPESLVRSGADPAHAVQAVVQDTVWSTARAFGPDDDAAAEQACRRALHALGAVHGGLSVTRASVQITADESLSKAVLERGSLEHSGVLSRIGMQHQAAQVEHLRGLLNGDEDLLLLHLAGNPGDTSMLIQLMVESRQRGEATRMTLLDKLFTGGYIQDGDLQGLRDALLGGYTGGPGTQVSITSPTPAAALGAALAPVPPSAPASPAPAAPPTPAAGAASTPLPADDTTATATAPPTPAGPGGVVAWKPLGNKGGKGGAGGKG